MADQEEARLREELLAPPKIVIQSPEPVTSEHTVNQDGDQTDKTPGGDDEDEGESDNPFRSVNM